MHGELDAMHMFDLHTKLVHKKEITWSELENMIPFEKEAYINTLLKTLEDEANAKKPSKMTNDVIGEWTNYNGN